MKRAETPTIPALLAQHSQPIETVAGPLGAADFAPLLAAGRPVLIANGAAAWPASQRWSFEMLAARGATTQVVLEYGNVMQRETRFERTTLAGYVERLLQPRDPNCEHAYLSVFELFEAMPELRHDVDFEPLRAHRAKCFLRGWLGPAGTVTGLHADYPDNLLAQIRGRKIVHLISPAETDKLYPSNKYEYGIRMSSIDFQRYDSKRWPRVQTATIVQAMLNPGDLLFIPAGWWHHVMSLDPSISINCFAVTWGAFLRREGVELVRKSLHELGLLGREGCTCHGMMDGRRVSRRELIRRQSERDHAGPKPTQASL